MKIAKQNIFSLLAALILLSPAELTADFDLAAGLYRQKDYLSAFEAFHDLANDGDPRAMTIVALMFKYGEGTQQDMTEAFKWYYSAAEQGYPPAQFHTGKMYAAGLGTEQDHVQAIHWLTLAADQGFDRAIDQLTQLNVEFPESNRSNELIAWSTNWNFRLPNSIRDADPDPATEAPEISDSAFVIQVGAMGSKASADRLWQTLQSTHTDLFADLSPRFKLSENSDRRIYRIQTGSFTNLQQASQFCEKLQKHPIPADCIPVKNN